SRRVKTSYILQDRRVAGRVLRERRFQVGRFGLLLRAREGGAAPPIRRDALVQGGGVERAAAPHDVRKLALLFGRRLELVRVGCAHVFWHGSSPVRSTEGSAPRCSVGWVRY